MMTSMMVMIKIVDNDGMMHDDDNDDNFNGTQLMTIREITINYA